MHYIIDNHVVVKAENAALTTQQTNKEIIKYISSLSDIDTALDYGCGKLRHAIPLSKKTNNLVVLDSKYQILRKQKIDGYYTTVIDYANAHMSNAVPAIVEEYVMPKSYFDFVLCTNVLSSIPCHEVRHDVLNNIYLALKNNGVALISVQYSNSYFKTYSTNPNANEYLDGWLIKKSENAFSFYGIIKPTVLQNLCQNVGFYV